MAFRETYKAEVLQSRRIRAQRASFWAKALGFVLMVVIAAVLRAEPQLRQALVAAAVDTVGVFGGPSETQRASLPRSSPPAGAQEQQQLQDVLSRINRPPLPTGGADQLPPRHRFQDAVKVNRFGGTVPAPSQLGAARTSPEGAPTQDAEAVAQDLSQILKAMAPGQ